MRRKRHANNTSAYYMHDSSWCISCRRDYKEGHICREPAKKIETGFWHVTDISEDREHFIHTYADRLKDGFEMLSHNFNFRG